MTEESKEVEKEEVKEALIVEENNLEVDYNSFDSTELEKQLAQLILTENIYSVAKEIEVIKAVFIKK